MAALSRFLVAGGSAYATHELILSSDIVDGEVKTPDIANAAVVTDKLAQAAVTSGRHDGRHPATRTGYGDFGIECAEFLSGGLDFRRAKIAAVAISPD